MAHERGCTKADWRGNAPEMGSISEGTLDVGLPNDLSAQVFPVRAALAPPSTAASAPQLEASTGRQFRNTARDVLSSTLGLVRHHPHLRTDPGRGNDVLGVQFARPAL
jgi:hypothetical protein